MPYAGDSAQRNTVLYDSKSFGPVSDPAMLKITDEVTLMAAPAEMPSSVETTRSLIESARNLEYYIKIFPKKPAASIPKASSFRTISGVKKMAVLSKNDRFR